MSVTATDVRATIEARLRDLQELATNAEKAAALTATVASMRQDVARLEKQHAKFMALGDGHVEVPAESFDARYGCVIAWQPIRSLLTGKQLAAQVEKNLEHLRAEIIKADDEIDRLLAS